MSNERKNYIKREVINEDLETVGTVTDVIYGDEEEPTWLVVKPGPLQAERYVPIEGSYVADDGNVVVPFEKRWIKAAPKAGDHVLTRDVEVQAADHYDVDR